jgi:putative SOS response-associated peptidase YedK
MCGRFTYLFKWKQLQRLMGLVNWPELELSPRYNVAPTQAAPVVRQDSDGTRVGAMLKWGLIPSWADDPSIGNRLINARGETVAAKPAFRTAFARRRCLVPVSGFYEWKVLDGDRGKQPFLIGRADGELLVFAGLWEHWEREGRTIDSFTVITTTANRMMSSLHGRMPVILDPGDFDRWLDCGKEGSATALPVDLIKPYRDDGLEAVPVSTRINSPKNDDSTLIQRLDEPPSGLFS